jgi:hypothetical protein
LPVLFNFNSPFCYTTLSGNESFESDKVNK